ncbi:stem-specific protein TSJT1-like [Nymphaea colorata]|nr:stem-specific protein TSJT1-like [Nymphaea colorata]
MLAVFEESVAKSPQELKSPVSDDASLKNGRALIDYFASNANGSVAINLGSSGSLAYSTDRQNPLLPRMFAVVDDIYCLFEGHLDNITLMKQQYGLSKTANEVGIVIEAYRTLRDRGPYPADQVVRDLHGKYAFVIFDASTKTSFIALDADGSVPFFWGTDLEGRLVFCDDSQLIKMGCGKSFAPFPKGCFFTTSGGLKSFEHPLNALKPMPRVDSQGQVCGATFKVDSSVKKDTGMPRVGSAANWSSQF